MFPLLCIIFTVNHARVKILWEIGFFQPSKLERVFTSVCTFVIIATIGIDSAHKLTHDSYSEPQ